MMNTNIYYTDAVKEIIISNTKNNGFNIIPETQELLNNIFYSNKVRIETTEDVTTVKMNRDVNKTSPFYLNAKELLSYIVENNIFLEDAMDKGFICHNNFGTFYISAK